MMDFKNLFVLLLPLSLGVVSLAQQNPPRCLQTCNAAFWTSTYGTRCIPGEISCACRMQYNLILPCCLQEACTGAELDILEGMNNVRDACMDDSGDSPQIEVGECDARYEGALEIEDGKVEVPTVIIESSKTSSQTTSTAEGDKWATSTETEPATTTSGPTTASEGVSKTDSSMSNPSRAHTPTAGFETRAGSSFISTSPQPTSTTEHSEENSDLAEEDRNGNESEFMDPDQNLGVGLGVGMGLGLPLSGLVLFLFWRAKRRDKGHVHRESHEDEFGKAQPLSDNRGSFGNNNLPVEEPSEMWTPPTVFEMPGDKRW